MSLHELKQDGIQPLKLDLSESETATFNKFRTIIDATDASFQRITDATLHRFLLAAHFNCDKAVTNFKNYMAWRKEKNLDNWVDPNPQMTELIFKISPHGYYGCDKAGRPIYIEKAGKLCTELLTTAVTVEEFVSSHISGLERLGQNIYESSLKAGKEIDGIVAIFDLEGLNLSHRNALPYLKACSELDLHYYPNKTVKIFILNAPWVVNVIWPLAQVFIDDVTQSRLKMVSGVPKDTLLQYIDEDQLPVEYGGSNPVNVIVPDTTELIAKYHAQQSDDGLDKFNVPAGSAVTQSLSCGEEGGVFSWYFISPSQHDVEFGVEDQTKKIVLKEKARCVTHQGEYVSDGACTLSFVFDNAFSWITSKDISALLTVTPKNKLLN